MLLPRRGAQSSSVAAQVECQRGMTFSELQDDAEQTVHEILRVVERFCIATKGIVADSALQETAHFLQFEAMPKVVLVLRGPAHVIRIACQELVRRIGLFEEQYTPLFGDRHALLKDWDNKVLS